jgi:hypothetical protein
MLLSAVSVLVIVLQSPEIPEGLMNNPVCVQPLTITFRDILRRLKEWLNTTYVSQGGGLDVKGQLYGLFGGRM